MKTLPKQGFAACQIAVVIWPSSLVASNASAQIASPINYLAPVIAQMRVQWPKWMAMIEKAQAAGEKVFLLTPTLGPSAKLNVPCDFFNPHAEQIRPLAVKHHVGLVDSLAAFKTGLGQRGAALKNFIAQVNHPNSRGHRIVATEIEKSLG